MQQKHSALEPHANGALTPVDEPREPWFVSAAHGDEEVATSRAVFDEAPAEALG